MFLKVDFNPSQLLQKFKGLQTTLDKNLTTASYVAAQYVQAQAKLNIQGGTRSGRIYRRKNGITHRASAEGEYPKSDTGRLASSISIEKGVKYSIVGSNLVYAPLLENGTSYMGARPWLQRTYDDNIGKINMIFSSALRATFK